MISFHASRIPGILERWPLLLAVSLGLVLLLTATRPMGAAEPGASGQCVACHTDPARLKALTPPDPPLFEEGEG